MSLSRLPIGVLGEVSKYLSQRDLNRLKQVEKDLKMNVESLLDYQKEKVYFGLKNRGRTPFFKFKSSTFYFNHRLYPAELKYTLEGITLFIDAIGNKDAEVTIMIASGTVIAFLKLVYQKSTDKIQYQFINALDGEDLDDVDTYESIVQQTMYVNQWLQALIDFEKYLQTNS
jgi:hypothetical protein